MTTYVRWGEKVYSPLIGPGEADYLLAFEKLEALRHIELLRPGGIALVSDCAVPPLSVSSGSDEYPNDERIMRIVGAVTPNYYLVPAITLAEELGNPRVNNVVLLGSLSYWLRDVPLPVWLDAIHQRVPPKFTELNEQAFSVGKEAMQKLQPCPEYVASTA